ncbi:FixH family protein [Nocardia sp. NPDC052254]|uniref:FixH family protein n=1 Tax=Nocardia sp. NPDC052254 TaxID=3155681 RepID=UPI003419DDF0
MSDRSDSHATGSADATLMPMRRGRVRVIGGVLVALAVLAATMWWLWPARHTSRVVHGGTAAHLVTVTLDDRVGTSDIGIELADRSGKPVSHAMIEVQAVEPRMGYAGEPVVAADHGAGSYRASGMGFMTTGPWQLRLSIATAGGAEKLSLPLWIDG